MTVYVDDVEHAFGRMKMCHMWADTEAELLAMARTIGVNTKWIQGHPTLSFGKHKDASWVHFDIAKGKRARAIAAGAVLTDMYGPVEHTCNITIRTSQDPKAIERAANQIERIKHIRARS